MAATETVGPFDGTPWAQDQWYRYASTWVRSGVLDVPQGSSSGGGLGLSFNGLTPTLAAGRAWVRGAGYELSGGSKTMAAVPANTNASLYRRDRIVLRRDLAAKTVTPVLILGTAASSPAAPAVQQVDTGQWDLPLFSFLTPPASGTAITGIVDERLFVDPAGGAQSVYSLANLTAIDTAVAAQPGSVVYESSTGRHLRWDGSKRVKSAGPAESIYSNGNLGSGAVLPAGTTTNPVSSQAFTAPAAGKARAHFVVGIRTNGGSGSIVGSMTVTFGDANYVQTFTVSSGSTTPVVIDLDANVLSGTSTLVMGVSLNAGPDCITDYSSLRITM